MYRYVLSYPFGTGLVGKEGEDPAPGTNIQHNLACNTVRQSLPYRNYSPCRFCRCSTTKWAQSFFTRLLLLCVKVIFIDDIL